MIDSFTNDVIQQMELDSEHKYYVYGLLNPFNNQPFYVGKGIGNRVFQHAKNALTAGKDDDDISLKIATIQDIMNHGKEVICIIYHWGLTENEAFAVESTLIDCFPNLTNEQSGHDNDHGLITAEDLQNRLSLAEYDEPKEDYVIIKTSNKAMEEHSNLYDATRGCWKATLEKAQRYKYVLAVVQGIVREVYEVSEWHTSAAEAPRIEFTGVESTNPDMHQLVGKRLPAKYMQKGAANPFMYKKK